MMMQQSIEQFKVAFNEQCCACNRNPNDCTVVAVSKKQSTEKIIEAYNCGQLDFGENYLQELQSKHDELEALPIIWHFIGAIQSNKAAEIAKIADWVHSIERIKIARILNDSRPAHLPPINVCIQVNLHQESQKAGIPENQVIPLIEAIQTLEHINLRGLMLITPANLNEAQSLASFQSLTALFNTLKQAFPHLNLDTLSMGMSGDWKMALAGGSTMLRIGSSIFGERL